MPTASPVLEFLNNIVFSLTSESNDGSSPPSEGKEP